MIGEGSPRPGAFSGSISGMVLGMLSKAVSVSDIVLLGKMVHYTARKGASSFMRSKIARAVAAKAITSFFLLAAGVGVRAQSRVIDQLWQFSPDPGAQFTAANVDRQAKWRPDRAGLSWNAQFEDLRDYAGVGWYRVTITLPQPLPSTRELIHFGAVDYFTEVWVNGIRLGEHEGGYTPFTFDLTGKVHAGNNEILLKVFDPPMPPAVPTRRTQNSEPPTEVSNPAPRKNPRGTKDSTTTKFPMASRTGMCRPAAPGSPLL